MVPIIDGDVYHFGPRGLYNGLLLMGDDETGSYWDHMTGVCVHGPLKGKRMSVRPIRHVKVEEALENWPNLPVALSKPSLHMRLWSPVLEWIHKWAILPPGFKNTMGKPDERLPQMTSGLGLISSEIQRFYPVDTIRKAGGEIRDEWKGREVRIRLDPNNHPRAVYADGEEGEVPMQLFSRWYGFSFTYPECEVYGFHPHHEER